MRGGHDPAMTREPHIKAFNDWAAADNWQTQASTALDFQSAKLGDCVKVWTDAAGSRPLAARADLTPRNMRTFLTHVMLADVVRDEAGTRFRMRVIGSDVVPGLGGQAGHFINEIATDPFNTRWQRLLDLALVHQAPLHVREPVQFGNRIYLHGEAVTAPLIGQSGEIDNMLIVHVASPYPIYDRSSANRAGWRLPATRG